MDLFRVQAAHRVKIVLSAVFLPAILGSAQARVIQDLDATALSAAQGPASASLLEGRGDPFQNPAAMALHGLSPNLVSATFIPMSLGRYAQALSYQRSLTRSSSAGVQARLISTGSIDSRDAAGTRTGEIRYTEWEAGGGASWRSRYHFAAGFLLQGLGQGFTGSSSGGLQAAGGILIRPFLSYPLHVGATTRIQIAGPLAQDRVSPGGNWGLGYELLPDFWAGAGGGYGSSKQGLGGALAWTHPQVGASIRGSASRDRVAMGAGYLRKGRYRIDYTFVLGLTGPSSRHLATTEFEF